MQTTTDPPAESDKETSAADSENILENVKYIQKLTLQRSVLNKLVASDLNPIAAADDDPVDPDSIQSFIK